MASLLCTAGDYPDWWGPGGRDWPGKPRLLRAAQAAGHDPLTCAECRADRTYPALCGRGAAAVRAGREAP